MLVPKRMSSRCTRREAGPVVILLAVGVLALTVAGAHLLSGPRLWELTKARCFYQQSGRRLPS